MAVISELKKKSKNLLNGILCQKDTITNGVEVKYLEDEDCFLLNGTSLNTGSLGITYVNIPITYGDTFSLSSTFVSGTITKESGKTSVAFFGMNDEPNKYKNWKNTGLATSGIVKNEKQVCNANYITAFWFYVSDGVTFTDYKVQIQLEKGETATTYEPYYLDITRYNKNIIRKLTHDSGAIVGLPLGNYHFAKKQEESSLVCDNAVEEPVFDIKITGNSVQNGTPTPENPIEIQSVGERTKNLVDIPDIDSSTQSTTISCNLTKNFSISCQEYPSSIQNTSGVETSIWRIMYTYQDGTLQYTVDNALKGLSGFISKINASEENPVISITYRGIYIRQGAYKGIQIEYGETVTDYEPYGYKLPVKVKGKNLFDYTKMVGSSTTVLDNSVRVKGYSTTTKITPEMFLEMTGLKEGDQITTSLSKKIIYGTVNAMFGVLMFYKQPIGTGQDLYLTKAGLQNNEISVGTVTIPSDFTFNNYGYLFAYGGFADDNGNVEFELSNIQIEKGTTATAYEPYIESTTTNIYLNEPLRKIGDYADYIDYKNKKVVRNVSEKIFYGTESISKNNKSFQYVVTDGVKAANVRGEIAFCNYYKRSNEHVNIYNGTVSNVFILSSVYFGSNCLFNIADNRFSTTNEYLAYLKELYDSSNPLKLVYPLETPKEETIELHEISTQDGTNIFEIETTIKPSATKINYWKQI